MIDTVSALFIDPRGPYPGLVADCWDAARDAKRYAGPRPVVAHPPCGPWGAMRGLATRQDPACGPSAAASVRLWGGVLEHPEGSRLFRHAAMPWPSELPDAWGGRSYLVHQVAWGHVCEKRTWIYVVGLPSAVVAHGIRTGGTPTHRVTSGPRWSSRASALPSASRVARARTPLAFAEWLVSLAASSGGCR